VILPRRKKGQDPGGLRHVSVDVTYILLESLFHLRLKDAAREIGLSTTTFKKACRPFMERWPSPKGQRDAAIARRKARTEGVDAAFRTLHQEPICAPNEPVLQTEGHHDKHAVTVACTSPHVWHDRMWDSSNASSSTSVTASSGLHRDCVNPFGTILEGLLRRHTTSFSPTASLSSNVTASSELDCASPLETGPPRSERSCVEAVMEYLDLACPISEADVKAMLSNDDESQCWA
jgi:hypothetical protein